MEIIEIYGFNPRTHSRLPFFNMPVAAGKPIPIETDIDHHIDLNEYLVDHPASTFFARVTGDQMEDVGIFQEDILIVDTSVDPSDGKIVIATLNGELVIKYYRNVNGEVYLESQNRQFLPLTFGGEFEFKVLGVVTKIIHSL